MMNELMNKHEVCIGNWRGGRHDIQRESTDRNVRYGTTEPYFLKTEVNDVPSIPYTICVSDIGVR